MGLLKKIKKILSDSFLCIKYPFLYPRSVVTGKPLYIIPRFTLIDQCPNGWQNLFKEYLPKLRKQLIQEDCLYDFRIHDIKEKWGELRIYHNGSLAVHELLNEMCFKSYDLCICCGKPATKMSAGWINPYCDNCFPKDKRILQEKIGNDWVTYAKDKKEV